MRLADQLEGAIRRDATAGDQRWALSDISALFDLPFIDLVAQANEVHRDIHWPNHIELADPGVRQSAFDDAPDHPYGIVGHRTVADSVDRLGRVHAPETSPFACDEIGMTENRADRIGFVFARANLPEPPETVSMNAPVCVAHRNIGDPLEPSPPQPVDDIEFIRTVAVIRITIPRAFIRLGEGQEAMSDTTQALCFMAGANSVQADIHAFTAARTADRNMLLFAKLGLSVSQGLGAGRAYEPFDIA